MTPFEIEMIVSEKDIDHLNHVNNVVYLQWVQDIATKHWNQLKEGHVTSNDVWVVIRHELDYSSQATLNDVIKIKTWIGETTGVKSIRHVAFYKGERLLVKAKTFWCLVDAKTLRPRRITGEILKVLIPYQHKT